MTEIIKELEIKQVALENKIKELEEILQTTDSKTVENETRKEKRILEKVL